jgi:GcrA cell cycle regulator
MTQVPMRIEPSPAVPQSGTEQRARKLANGKFVTTLTLTAETCKWPIGDPTEADFHYCGQRPAVGRPYCEAHENKSYQGSSRGRTVARPSFSRPR